LKSTIIYFLLTFVFTYNVNTFAEYRVYQYHIKARHPSSVSRDPYLITSTLSPTSYLAYHGGSQTLEIDLLRTWMCYGNTSYKDTCAPPLNLVLSKNKGNKLED
jgi:hypothetical protein